MIRRAGHIACIITMWAIGGCASTSPEAKRSSAQPDSLESFDSGDRLRKLTAAENGLEVRKWTVHSDSMAVAEALVRWQDNGGLDAAVCEQLQRNGFRLIRIPVEQLEVVSETLGGAMLDVTEWHGQVLQWRELLRYTLPDEGLALAVDGRVRRVNRGSVGLLSRSWTVPLENGPALYLELVPRYHPPDARDLRHLIGRDPDRSRPFTTLALQMELEAGYAYVLLGESPQAEWRVQDDEISIEQERPDAVLASIAPSSLGPPVDPLGPGAMAPQTLGELMLIGHGHQKNRGMVVFVPRVPREMYPPDHPAIPPPSWGGADE
jgi:hypothetical protein